MLRVLILPILCMTAACGIEETGLSSDAGPDGSPIDTSVDVATDVVEEPVVCADAGVASCEDAADFRAPALFSPDGTAACPAGYTRLDLANAAPSTSTCTCQCITGGTPSCDTNVANWHGGTASCNVTNGSVALSGSCTTSASSIVTDHIEIDVPKVTGCGGGTPVAPSMTTKTARLCVPQCTSDESVCSPHAGLQACVYLAGTVASCPSNYPNGPVLIGATPSVQCDPCSCAAQGDCSHSEFHYYSSGNCTTGDEHVNMDGTCHSGGGGLSWLSAQVKPNLMGYSCIVSDTFASIAYASNEYTICCK